MYKKILVAILAAGLVFSLPGCGNSSDTGNSAPVAANDPADAEKLPGTADDKNSSADAKPSGGEDTSDAGNSPGNGSTSENQNPSKGEDTSDAGNNKENGSSSENQNPSKGEDTSDAGNNKENGSSSENQNPSKNEVASDAANNPESGSPSETGNASSDSSNSENKNPSKNETASTIDNPENKNPSKNETASDAGNNKENGSPSETGNASDAGNAENSGESEDSGNASQESLPDISQITGVKKEILAVNVFVTGSKQEHKGNMMIQYVYFNGNCDNENFTGTILPGAVDEQHYPEGSMCATYTLEGRDSEGNDCKIDIVNRSVPGGFIPTIHTDSPVLSYLNDGPLTAELQYVQDGLVIHIFYWEQT